MFFNLVVALAWWSMIALGGVLLILLAVTAIVELFRPDWPR